MSLSLSSSPQLSARFSPDATGELIVDGVREDFVEESTQRVREAVLGRVGEIAAAAGRPVRLTVSDEEGDWLLAVQPDGSIVDEEALSAGPEPEHVPALFRAAPPLEVLPDDAPPQNASREAPARESFLRVERTRPDRARQGMRGALARAGVPLGPSAAELRERAELDAVSRHWAGPRTIAIVNGKGGANKTPTTALLSAVFARNGGSGVLAWDNNETRGTLGWRTEKDDHDATVQSLLPATDVLMSAGARTADIGHYMHHQNADKYDVLRSNPTMLATEQRISSADFDRLHAVATKFYRLVIIDSGNDESAERWLRMIDHTDQLVIATTALGEHAEAGALLLEALMQRDAHSARLAREAVVIVSQSERTGPASEVRRVATGFEPLARRAVTIPFDPEMHGGRLSFESLAPRTRRAWLHAAAAVAEGL
ncbi:AAA family ATPase [Leifsonia sp. fls2-241-R2A-40a]|uniref:MinD/ParA family ATP-binding protein n=1 Tax=Leifsonia sp. fls2-241-R2A-40a TaxID=3040290 RepID=UPI00254CD3CD|nr:AAA family ATPase [Leifsonia sp. fls2-241-R2A-40a]